MSFNLKDELFNLSSTAPKLRDPEDGYSDDETRAKVEAKSLEHNDYDFDQHVDNRRRIRPSVNDLSEFGKRYKGKSVSRKDIEDTSDDQEEEDEEVDDVDDDDDDDGDEDEDEDAEELEDENDEDDEEMEEDEEEVEEPINKTKKQKLGQNDEDKDLNLVNLNKNDEIAKGKAVKNQLNLWDLLLETRVKAQKVLSNINELPQAEKFEELTRKKSSSDHHYIKENQNYVVKAFNQLAELQQRLLLCDPETSNIINELTANESNSHSKKENIETNKKSLKRKRNGSEDDEDEEDDEENEEDDESDEEIYSDTDDEMRAMEAKKNKASKKLANFKFTPLKQEQFEEYLIKLNKGFQKYRNSTIQKWYDKTRLITGKSFQTLEKPILQQIEHILMDKDRIIKRTQLKRSAYKIIGKKETDTLTTPTPQLIGNERSSLKDYDQEIYDDQDFYNQLLRELIDRKSTSISDPIKLSQKSIELQQLRSKSKKVVDTKASKGRKIKFEIHKPLVNFMAPLYRNTMPEEAKNELFKSLFGNHITMLTTNGNGAGNENIDFNQIFKGF